MPDDMLFPVIMKSIANWQNAVGDAAYLKLVYQQPQALEAHLDGINTVKFRTDRWCHPDDAQQKDVCYSDAAAGITTVFFVQDGSAHAGTILDADIELNDINFTFAVLPTTGDPRAGHVVRRSREHAHARARPPAGARSHLQGRGDAAAGDRRQRRGAARLRRRCRRCRCAEQVKIKLATMYNFASPGEISKRSPEADDVNGIVNAYPAASDPGTCKPINLDDYRSGGLRDRRADDAIARSSRDSASGFGDAAGAPPLVAG